MSCEWLTVKEAAAYVKVTTHSIHRWIRTCRLPYSVTPGGERRICKAHLIQSEGRKGPTPYTGPYRQPPGPLIEET